VPELGAVEYHFATLFLTINRQGVIALWPAKLPSADRTPSDWQMSAMNMATLAMRQWIRVVPNMDRRAYDYVLAIGDWSPPEWPELSFREILKLAFRDNRVIDNRDHPVIRRLQGKE
jgi:hypothetical protein